jgi:hypothetical protein
MSLTTAEFTIPSYNPPSSNSSGIMNTLGPLSGFEPGNQYSDSHIEEKNIELDLHMVNNLKDKFSKNEFETKYQKILAKSTDPIIKSETVKLSTAAIIKTLKKYFNESDPDDESNMNVFLTEMVADNQELKYCIEKLNECKNKKENIEVIKDIENCHDIEIEIIEDEKDELNTILTKNLIEEKEAIAYHKTKIELEKLIDKRRNEIAGIFVQPSQDELNRIFKTKISINNKEDNNDKLIEEDNITKYEWNDVVDLFKKYDISQSVITLLTALNDFKTELNDTLANFISIQNTVDKFNNVITSQLNWLSNIPDCLDGSVIVENIESIIERYFDKEDIANLFKNYKKIYNKMMMLITFIPREFMAKNACAVCLSNKIDSVFVPCGHTCCSACGTSLVSCMVCRTKIDKKQKIYDI